MHTHAQYASSCLICSYVLCFCIEKDDTISDDDNEVAISKSCSEIARSKPQKRKQQCENKQTENRTNGESLCKTIYTYHVVIWIYYVHIFSYRTY